MISYEFIDWVENFLQQSVIVDIEQFMLSPGAKSVQPLMSVDKKGVATIPINGPLAPMPHALMKMFNGTSTSELKRSFDHVRNNPKIKGVLMPVNSPGGNNAMIDETASLINQVSSIKPVLAHTTGENGSAAYYLSSQANKNFAQNRTNRIGSIGTRLVISDDSEAMQKAGIKNIVIDTGKNKSVGVNMAQTPLSVQAPGGLFWPTPKEVVQVLGLNYAGVYEHELLSHWESRALRPEEGYAVRWKVRLTVV